MASLEPAIIAEIRRLVRETTATHTEIAGRLNLGMRTVRHYAAAVPREERRRPWSKMSPPELVAAVNDRLINTSDTYVSIARDLGTTDSTVRKYAALLEPGSFPARMSNARKAMPEELTATIIELAIAGLTAVEIGRRLGYSEFSVGKRIRSHRDEIETAKANAAPVHVEPDVSFEDRLRADGWDDDFIASTMRNLPRLSVAMQVSA